MSHTFANPRGFLTDLFQVAVRTADPMHIVPMHLPEKRHCQSKIA